MSPKSLSNFTSLHVGGPAHHLIRATTEAELISAVQAADAAKTPLLILGRGSNVLIGDEGFAGTVVIVETEGNSYDIDACSGGLLTVAAGEDWDEFVSFTISKGLANLESLSGVPGTIGAAPVQNIGAYGHEVGEVIARLRTYDRQAKKVVTFTADQCGFTYRNSIFKESAPRYVILDVTFHLRNGELSLPVMYGELANKLGINIGDRAPISDVRKAVMALRESKGMLSSQNIWSAGSFFTNPIVSADVAAQLPVDAPRWPQANGEVKTSAAWLMEHAGIEKGEVVKGAAISSLHVLALTNPGSATAADLIELARSAQSRVKAKFGITLEAEVRLVGAEL
jgi:UDP-N-acetylmuramate dehydrogenase